MVVSLQKSKRKKEHVIYMSVVIIFKVFYSFLLIQNVFWEAEAELICSLPLS